METTHTPALLKPLHLDGIGTVTTPDNLTQLLNRLPTKNFSKLIHVGTLGQGQQNNPSHEGPLLSASAHPKAWTAIARLGGFPQWEIRKEEPGKIRLLHMLHKDTSKILLEWALKHQLVEMQTWWWTPCDTSEEGEIYYCWAKNPDDEFDPELGEQPEAREIPNFTPKLWDFWNQRLTQKPTGEILPWHATDAIAALVCLTAQKILEPGQENIPDGLFWNETLDPDNLSAPRMGLIPHRKILITEK